MNYPLWDLPSSGLLIAFVAIVHVFVSHFAVGGGFFLVLTERRARRTNDAALLAYVQRHARFFVLLTIVFGAVTGVGIWFTISLVHPAATSALINTFVWGWAMEWTFFVAEVAAALAYYYGWERMDPRTHMTVGWIYAISAFMSLVIINGILAFMLTPGAWLTTRSFWDGFFNPTYASSVVGRTFAAFGLAGLYSLLTAARERDAALKRTLARTAALHWIVPSAVGMAACVAWYLHAAAAAGTNPGGAFGAPAHGLGAALATLASGLAPSGYPPVQRLGLAAIVASVLIVILALVVAFVRRERFGLPLASAALVLGLVAIGGAEWAREGLRKPYVIGRYMFVNGVRVSPAAAVPAPPPGFPADPFTVEALTEGGVLRAALFPRLPAGADEAGQGAEVFRLLCSACHTPDGHLAIRPLVAGMSSSAIEGVLGRLARPVTASGVETSWSDPAHVVDDWRGRRMPPFTGNAAEKRALAVYLAGLGGGAVSPSPAQGGEADLGARLFDAQCSSCHGDGGDFPLAGRALGTVDQVDATLRDLPAVNDMMPPFEGSDAERRALAEYLARLGGAR